MSRTIRRKGEKHRNKSGRSHFITNYITDSVRPPGVNTWHGAKRVFLEGKEYWRAYYMFHGCTHPRFGWGNHKHIRKMAEEACRMDNKRQLQRWYQDEDYEVFVINPRNLSWDR